jgi:beta-N-acetylhexosaminidase
MGPIITGIDGTELSQIERELLTHPLVGGVILFSRNYAESTQLIELTRQIKLCKPELTISVDHEGGRVQRFRQGFSAIPSMRDASHFHKTSPCLTELGWTLAAEVLAHGIDFSYTPVLDIDTVSTVIGNRAFSDNPEDVVTSACDFIAGLKLAGMKNVAKHFPGHGSVVADSHIAMPIDERSLSDIQDWDMQPFVSLMTQNLIDGVMPAHVIYPEVDTLPACFSARWLQTILKQQIGFKGAIISDDMGMQGAVQIGDYPTRVKTALDAGCDAVLLCNEKYGLEQVLDGLSVVNYQGHGQALQCYRQKSFPTLAEVKSDLRWQRAQKLIQQIAELQGA